MKYKPVYICCGATDMRKSINGLMALVENSFSLDPFADALFVFCNRKRNMLKIIPAKAVIVRHIQHVYACRNCEKSSDHVPIIKADMPAPVIKGSFVSPETIAHLAS